MPRVSIVTPSYNHAAFLQVRAASILEQEYRDFEWVIVDDASTDDSAALLHDIASTDSRIRLFTNSTNEGMAATTNRALDLASGEILHRAESDDFCHPGFLRQLMEVFDEHPRVGLAHCAVRRADSLGRLSGGWRQPHRGRTDPGRTAFRKLVRGNYIAGPATVFRRAALDTAGKFAIPPFEIACDYHFALRVCLNWDLAYVADRLYAHRSHGGNLSGLVGRTIDVNLLGREAFQLLDDAFDRLPPSWNDVKHLQEDAAQIAALRFGTSLFMAAMRRGEADKADHVLGLVEGRCPGLTTSRRWHAACRVRRVAAAVARIIPHRRPSAAGQHRNVG